MFKVIVAGSRGFNDYDLMKSNLDFLFSNKESVEIISGTAYGADKLGERYACDNKLKLHKFPADWDKYGKSAGYIRNVEMAKFADAVVVFWDGKSKGTTHMINIAIDLNLPLRIIRY